MTQIAETKPTAKDPKAAEPMRAIAVEKLLINHVNPHGVKIPDGIEGKGEKLKHTLYAGIEGDVKTEIDLLPSIQSFRVRRSRKVTRTEKGVEVESWTPMGKPFFLHQTLAVWVPASEQ